MEFIDARRLTGPNLLGSGPGAILDIACQPDQVNAVSAIWQRAVENMLAGTHWPTLTFLTLPLQGGVSLAFNGPIDSLYTATEISLLAWQAVARELIGIDAVALPAELFDLTAELKAEVQPALLAIKTAAKVNDVPFLWDDDYISLGYGQHSRTWPRDEIPDPQSLDWTRFTSVPIGIVTGTNGKTTVTRLASFILQLSGQSVGVSSTDSIAVNNTIIDKGDWSGPGGARQVLRAENVTAAVLETARGGLLRRGLGVERADVALITNIAEDHLGDFGSRSVHELLHIKWIVSQAVIDQGTLVLNADDTLLVNQAKTYPGVIVWFSLDEQNPVVLAHLARKGMAFVLEGSELVCRQGELYQPICDVCDIPVTLSGAARHNVANALAASALTHVMGTSLEAVKNGLIHMTQADNPGRCNTFALGDVSILVDFAHNPHAMQALFQMAQALPARRRLLAFAQAGDRPDDLIQEVARAAWRIGLDRVLISELAEYHRGRQHGEVFALMQTEMLAQGALAGQVTHFEQEIDALDVALDWAQPGDLVIILALGERDAIMARLAVLGAQASAR
jgi:UDP-N-acetylmuramyl tripeptide synthase